MEEIQNLRQWYDAARSALEHWEAAPAYYLLQTFHKHPDIFSQEYQRNPGFQNTAKRLVQSLFFVAFPELPPEEAQDVLKTQLLAFLQADVDFAERLSVRSVVVGYAAREADRQGLRTAILSNQERLGEKNIGEWLREFDRAYNPDERDERTVQTYITQNNTVASLDKGSLELLRRILQAYDQWLASELYSLYDLAVLNEKVGQQENEPIPATNSFARNTRPVSSAAENTVKAPLLQALSKYKNLGQQTLTGSRIKLKSQAEPVRPTLTNWLKVYRDELGIGHHDSVKRADFLYHSANTKNLSGEERTRIETIIRALEDDELVDIHPERQEIVFSGGSISGSSEQPTSRRETAIHSNMQGAVDVPDIFDRFQPTEKLPAHNFPSSLSHVGTKTFTPPVQARAPKQESETELLQRIQHMPDTVPSKTTDLEAHIRPQAPAQVPLGKIQFTSKQVFPGERMQPKKAPVPPQARPAVSSQPIPRASQPPREPKPTLTQPPVPAPPETPNPEHPGMGPREQDSGKSSQSMFHIKPSNH